MQIAPLSEHTQAQIRLVVAPEASVVNPVDMIATAGPRQYEASVRAVAQDPNIDVVVTIFTSLEMIDGPEVAAGIVRGAAGCGKPVLVCFMGNVRSREAIDLLRAGGLAVYTFPEDAARAHVRARALPRTGSSAPKASSSASRTRGPTRSAAEIAAVRASGRTQLTLAEAQRVFEHAGIAVLPWREVRDADAASPPPRRSATRSSPSSAPPPSSTSPTSAACASISRTKPRCARRPAACSPRPSRSIPQATLVIQRMAAGGTEVIIGATRDPKFGPLLMFGLGGIFVEVLKDVAFRVHPISDIDAHDMVRAIKGFPLLAGVRGHTPVDLPSIETTLLRLDQLMADFPDIQEVDINPFFAAAKAGDCAAADARITLKAL